ncbi:hypothetical protein OFEAOIEE_LOCUS4903 [Methylorubrum extorquens]
MTYGTHLLTDLHRFVADGNHEQVNSITSSADRIIPDDQQSLIDIAIIARDIGNHEDSYRICRHILTINAENGFATYELATLDAMRGRHVEALLGLEKNIARMPGDERSIRFAARMSARIGDHAGARAYVKLADEMSPDNSDVAWLRELCDFMRCYPAGVADRISAKIENDTRYVSKDCLIDWARAALQDRRGFSMIRLGDGEGAFCRISSEDEQRYRNLYRFCRDDRARVWFNGEIDLIESGFTDTAFGLRQAMYDADVLGLPYRSWVAHEYQFCGPTGITCLVNALRLAKVPAVDRGQSWTTQQVHAELLQSTLLEKLVRECKRISLISCMGDAPHILKEAFDLDEVDFYKIPGEKAHLHLLGQDAGEGRHFPDRFNVLMDELSQPLHGQLFLVAGGILGKFYCTRIKQSGGVALDVGSIIDAWMGRMTRPNYGTSYTLPAAKSKI